MFSLVTPRKGIPVVSNVAVGASSAALLVPANKSRKTLVIQNQGAVTVFIGPSTVTISGPTTGYALFAGNTFTDNASDQAWYAIAASSTAQVNLLEVT